MIKGWLVGDQELIARLERFSPELQKSLQGGVSRLALKLLAHVKEDKLSDQVLHVRTGRLRRSINQRVESSGSAVYGSVGTNVSYARRHELGFNGTESVRAHLRMMKTAFGREVKNPRQIQVNAFSRRVNYPAHSFLRSALSDMRDEINAGLQQAVESAAKQVFNR